MKSKSLTIVSVSSEVTPFAKTGGLADVARSLPKALQQLGHRVIVVSPLHGVIDKSEHELKKWETPLHLQFGNASADVHIYEGRITEKIIAYFIDYAPHFSKLKGIYGYENDNQRYYLFCVATLHLLQQLDMKPDVIQCHDWHTGLIPYLLKNDWKEAFPKTATVFTIHNLVFQMGMAWWEIPEKKRDTGKTPLPGFKSKQQWKYINFAKRAIIHADMINTVSEQYAEEILTKEFGDSLHEYLKRRQDRLTGIINGIDYKEYNPETDPGVFYNYNAQSLQLKQKNKARLQELFKLPVKPNIPVIGIVSRLTEQKGFDLLMDIYEPLMRMKVQLVVMGGGDKKYTDFFRMLIRKYPKKVAAYLSFNQDDATKVYAGSDLFLMPSRFEPCGLGQLISLRYGSVPIVHAIGGLASTITDYDLSKKRGNGFVFQSYDSRDLLVAIARAVEIYGDQELWTPLVHTAMKESFSWKIPAKQYVDLFRKAIKYHKK